MEKSFRRVLCIFRPVIFITTCFLSLFVLNCRADVEKDYASERERMVSEQIEARGIQDSGVLRAMRKVQRHQFVPDILREQRLRRWSTANRRRADDFSTLHCRFDDGSHQTQFQYEGARNRNGFRISGRNSGRALQKRLHNRDCRDTGETGRKDSQKLEKKFRFSPCFVVLGSFLVLLKWQPNLWEEYKQETGKDSDEVFPIYEPTHLALAKAGIPGIENRWWSN